VSFVRGNTNHSGIATSRIWGDKFHAQTLICVGSLRSTWNPKDALRISVNANFKAHPCAVISGLVLCDDLEMQVVASSPPKKRRTFARAARILGGNINRDNLVCDAKTQVLNFSALE
jgi:hypothetical protein